MHVHTSASDGTLSPDDAVKAAHKVGLRAVGIVDHDTLDGIPVALEAGSRYGIEVLPGIELGSMFEEAEVHLIGYFPKCDAPELISALEFLREERRVRLRLMLDKLRELRCPLEMERVLRIAEGGVPGRPHVAYAMIEKGYLRSTSSAFERYLGIGRPAYVPRTQLSPRETVRVLSAASSIPVLAHPGSLRGRLDGEGFRRLFKTLLDQGLSGIEAYHPLHSGEESRRYKALASRLGLLVTGGSDFHGKRPLDEPGHALSAAVGEIRVPYELVVKLKERLPL